MKMKTNSKYLRVSFLILCGTCVAGLTSAQTNPRSNQRGTASQSTAQSGGTTAENVRVTRATNFLGTDVVANDGRKVGDIVDYYFGYGGADSHLAYIVVMTGGFLDMGGDVRAVPASAVTFDGDSCRVNVSSDQFWRLPVLPQDRQRFISDAQQRQRISQMLTQESRTATSSGTEDPSTGNLASNDPNQAGTPTGRMTGQQGQQGQRFVSFNELRNADAFGQQGSRLGYFVDAWINVNDNRAPYLEITPTFQPFRTNFDRRYAIPTAKLSQKREHYGYDMKLTMDELNQAEPVSEADGVRMLEEDRFGNTVLRVTVPQN